MAASLVVVAVLVALVLERRRPAPPTRDAYPVPRQLDRADFSRPDAPLLVVLFSSATCDSCAAMRTRLVPLESDEVAVEEVEHPARRELHRRYRVEAVPTTLVADADGLVRAAFVGEVPAADLVAAVAEARRLL